MAYRYPPTLITSLWKSSRQRQIFRSSKYKRCRSCVQHAAAHLPKLAVEGYKAGDRDTGRPRGFAFLEMSSADASRAMQALNGKDFDGRALKINEAQDKPSSAGGNARY